LQQDLTERTPVVETRVISSPVRSRHEPPARETVAATPAPQARSRTTETSAAVIAHEYLREGHDLAAVGEWGGAVEAFQMAVEINPTAETTGALGALYFRLAAPNGAYRYLKRAVEMQPENADRWIALANALQLRGNPGEAWQALAEARRLQPQLIIERDASGFAYRSELGAESVFHASRFIPSQLTRRTTQ